MKKFLLQVSSILFLCIGINTAKAQLLYSKSIGTPGIEWVYDMKPAADGKSYFVVGQTFGAVDDTTFGFILKMDTSGNLLWKKIYIAVSDEVRFDRVFENSIGEVIVTGMLNANKQCGLFLKLTSTGEFIDLKRYQLTGPHTPTIVSREIIENPDHSYAMIGYAGLGFNDWIIMWMHVDSFGNPLHHHQYGNLRDDHPIALFHDDADGYYMVSRVGNAFNEHAGFARIYNLSSTGEILSSKNVKPSVDTDLAACIKTADGNYLLIGNTPDTSYLMKLNSGFDPVWIKYYPPSWFQSVSEANDGTIWMTGRYRDLDSNFHYKITKTNATGEVLGNTHLNSYCANGVNYDSFFSIPRGAISFFNQKIIFCGAASNCSINQPSDAVVVLELNANAEPECLFEPVTLESFTGPLPELQFQGVDYNDFIDFQTFEDTLTTYSFGEIQDGCLTTQTITGPAEFSELLVYPNPSSESIVVQTPQDCTMLQFVDCLGRILYEEKNPSTTILLDVSAWNQGVYWLKATDNQEHSSIIPILIQ